MKCAYGLGMCLLVACSTGNGIQQRPLLLPDGVVAASLTSGLAPPDTLRFAATVVGDRPLSVYRFAFAPVVDSLLVRTAPADLNVTRQQPLTGMLARVADVLTVPAAVAPGAYRITALATDVDGFVSDTLRREVTVVNDGFPVLQIVTPTNHRTLLRRQVGDTLRLRLLATDAEGMRTAQRRLYPTRQPAQTLAGYTRTFPVGGQTNVTLTDSLLLSADQLTADSLYTLEVSVDDGEAQQVTRLIRLKITRP